MFIEWTFLVDQATNRNDGSHEFCLSRPRDLAADSGPRFTYEFDGLHLSRFQLEELTVQHFAEPHLTESVHHIATELIPARRQCRQRQLARVRHL